MATLLNSGDLAVIGLTEQVFSRHHLIGLVTGLANHGLRIAEWVGEAHVERPDPALERYVITIDNPTFSGPEFVIPWRTIQLVAVTTNFTATGQARSLSPQDAVNFHLWTQRFVTAE